MSALLLTNLHPDHCTVLDDVLTAADDAKRQRVQEQQQKLEIMKQSYVAFHQWAIQRHFMNESGTLSTRARVRGCGT